MILPPDAGIDRGLSRAIRIAVSGLTAAGKTTHSKLLAAHYRVPYVAMLPVMTAVLNERYPGGIELAGLAGVVSGWRR